jgi:hypothetical protein
VDQIQIRIYDVNSLFEDLGNIFLLYCIVALGLSFIYVSNRHPTGHNTIRGLIAGLCVSPLRRDRRAFWENRSLTHRLYNAINSDFSSSQDFLDEPYLIIQLTAAFDIILWIASVAVAPFTIYVFIVCRETTRVRNVI